MKIDFYKHNLTAEDKKACRQVLDSLFLTTGEVVKNFEEKFAAFTGNKYAIGVNSCTDALFLALKYYDVKPGDEVITTPMSFMATANVVEHCGAKPIFVDVEAATGNIDANLIEPAITPNTKAIIVVHLYGQLCDMKKIRAIADKHNLKIIEDCAHCVEGERDGIKVGQLGDIACYSFYATKNLTSGEGGALTCNDQTIADWLRRARSHGMSKNAADRYTKRYEHYDMELLGYKTNMTNIQASLMIHQIDHLRTYLAKKEAIAQKYNRGFKKNKHISVPSVLPNSLHARHLYTIWVKPEVRDELLNSLQEQGLGIAINFRVIHLLSYYQKKYGYTRGSFPVAEKIGDSTITLPFYPKLSSTEVKYVIETVNQATSV